MSDYDFESWTDEEITRIQTGTNLKRPSDHQSMFKYIGLNSEASWDYLHRTLHNFELLGSAALSLNDPFELSPFIFDDLQPSKIAVAIRYSHLLERLSGKEVKPVGDLFRDAEPYRQRARLFLDSVAARYRIIAFCERSDSGLLWSHYANSYQGACLHFLAKGFRWKMNYTLGYVHYSKYRPTYPLSLALSLSSNRGGRAAALELAESDKILFFTKAEDWSYESEMRLVYDSKRSPNVIFHQDSLVSIIAGPRFSDESYRRLAGIINGSPHGNIAIRKARLSKTTFSVEIDD
jgi:Protein of unknown function (DUF2971)